jgi:predicted RNase H-like HicB family nuclease
MKKTKLTIYQMPVFVEKDNKWFSAFCPSLQGCYAQGRTLEQALKNIREVIELHIEDRIKEKEAIPVRKLVSLSALEVAV